MNNASLISMQGVISETGLPIRPDEIENAASSVLDAMLQEGFNGEEAPERFRELWDTWLSGVAPSRELKQAVAALFKSCAQVSFLGSSLFKLHDDLVEKDYLTHEQAMDVIGSAERIVTLAKIEKMCAYMITDHLGIEGITFDSIQRLLRLVNAVPVFSLSDAKRVMQLDRNAVVRTFKDDDDRQALDTLGDELAKLNCPGSIVDTIRYLDADVDHEPYMFMIHFELLPLEKYDRYPGRGVYEFSPRGEACNYLWHDEYKNPTQNPYLNNAKGFAALDMTWAENRKGKQGVKNGPVRLVELFDELNKLPYPSRRHAGRLIRRWLCRRLSRRLDARPSSIPMPDKTSRIAFFEKTGAANTSTLGIIDQRVCDMLAMLDQPERMRQKARGLGSSVNETNLSAAKLGDVEFVDYINHTIVGYEAHGGQLRDEYIDLHINTMKRILDEKRPELREEADPSCWSIEVKYVAHDISPLVRYKTRTSISVGDYQATVVAMTYSDLIDELGGPEAVADHEDLFNLLIHQPLNYGKVPDQIASFYYELVSF